ncbi:MAG: hypothetical protein ACMXYC_04095 [Candidatus Woesearchaeota archaeon]
MRNKETKSRILINKLLEDAQWRFFDNEFGKANIQLENNVKITQNILNEYGKDFEKTKNGFVDFLLLDEEVEKFISMYAKDEEKQEHLFKHLHVIKQFINAYITDKEIQDIMDKKEYTRLATNPRFNMKDLKELNGWVDPVIDYIKDYVSPNVFV